MALRVVGSEPHRVARQRQRVAMRADILGEHEREVQHRVRVRRVERYRALEVRSRARGVAATVPNRPGVRVKLRGGRGGEARGVRGVRQDELVLFQRRSLVPGAVRRERVRRRGDEGVRPGGGRGRGSRRRARQREREERDARRKPHARATHLRGRREDESAEYRVNRDETRAARRSIGFSETLGGNETRVPSPRVPALPPRHSGRRVSSRRERCTRRSRTRDPRTRRAAGRCRCRCVPARHASRKSHPGPSRSVFFPTSPLAPTPTRAPARRP